MIGSHCSPAEGTTPGVWLAAPPVVAVEPVEDAAPDAVAEVDSEGLLIAAVESEEPADEVADCCRLTGCGRVKSYPVPA